MAKAGLDTVKKNMMLRNVGLVLNCVYIEGGQNVLNEDVDMPDYPNRKLQQTSF